MASDQLKDGLESLRFSHTGLAFHGR
jgi:hypothetical protein